MRRHAQQSLTEAKFYGITCVWEGSWQRSNVSLARPPRCIGNMSSPRSLLSHHSFQQSLQHAHRSRLAAPTQVHRKGRQTRLTLLTVALAGTFWMETASLHAHGKSAYSAGFKVFRNVKDYGVRDNYYSVPFFFELSFHAGHWRRQRRCYHMVHVPRSSDLTEIAQMTRLQSTEPSAVSVSIQQYARSL